MDRPYEVMRRHWATLTRPSKLEVIEESARHARFVCEPLERGYADTLGVALKRALRGAVPGAAIVAARATSGVMPPSVEWMTDLCLNLSQVVIDMTGEALESRMVRIEAPQGTAVHAQVLERPGLRIVNPELLICSAEQDLALDLWIECGYGVKMADVAIDLAFGAWPVDAFFGPVRRVEYTVAHARVGTQVDFDSLRMDVTTNGSVTPRKAVWIAAKTLSSQLGMFINFVEQPEPKPTAEVTPAAVEHLFARVSELELSVRLSNCLNKIQVEFIGQLAQLTEKQLMSTRSFGRKSLNEVYQILAERGLALGMTLPNWQSQLADYQAQKQTRS